MDAASQSVVVNRSLTAGERLLIRWMLEHGVPGGLSFLAQLENAKVVSQCACGCASINFEIAGQPTPQGNVGILADFVFGSEANLCGIFVFEKSGVLAGLEVHGLAVNPPSQLPTPAELRPISDT